MAKKVPFFADYKTIGRISTVSDWTLWLAVISALVSLSIDLKIFKDLSGKIQHYSNIVSCFLAVVYFTIDMLTNYLFQCAEAHRRNDFFDNSLNTVLADENTEEYFTNDNVAASIYKLGVNGFENSFFTLNISSRALKGMVVKSTVVFFIFLTVALFAGERILLVVLQLALPLTIIQQTIRMLVFKNRIEQVHENFKRIFAMSPGDKQDNLLIHNVTNYETTLAWASIKLPNNLFNKMNGKLSLQWTAIKNRLNIQ
jgi:hypothetical protein